MDESERNTLLREWHDYALLRNNIVVVKDRIKKSKDRIIRTKVELGEGVYVTAENEGGCDTVFIHIGLGFYIEFTFDEALKHIEEKLAIIQQRLNADKAGKARARAAGRV